jgi:hypothetical protein
MVATDTDVKWVTLGEYRIAELNGYTLIVVLVLKSWEWSCINNKTRRKCAYWYEDCIIKAKQAAIDASFKLAKENEAIYQP